MDDLNAQQIVLLTLLVSFVTSIATGITTVSLLEKAPEPITQTINRVVEKTVERVIETDDGDKPVEKIVETVVVNAEDLTIDAVQKNSDSLVRIYTKSGGNKAFVSMGIVISGGGDILADAAGLFKGATYVGVYSTGEKDLELFFRESNNPFAVLKIKGENTETFVPAAFGDSQGVKLGQSVIALSGQSSNYVLTGIITSLDKAEIPADPADPNSQPSTLIKTINTSVTGPEILTGSVLLNLKGEILGARINTGLVKSGAFLPSADIKSFISSGLAENSGETE
ncbi:MAG TPA: hypothetical protein P5328_01070 [Candidatus Paceibacterota bacterium]|nr:hypothetical protein [Candidatus Paceibacterota bacterium]HRZ34581.1 hypothetical protein [Candidatus Paceibacterota bacterium]